MADYTIEDVEKYLMAHPLLEAVDPATVLGPAAEGQEDSLFKLSTTDVPPADDPSPSEPAEQPAEEPAEPPAGDEEPEEEGEPGPDEEGTGDDQPPPAPDPELAPEELAQLRALQELLRTDRGLQQRLVEHYAGIQPTIGSPSVPSTVGPQAPNPPDPTGALDLEDPQIAALYSLVQQQGQQLAQFAQQQQLLAQRQQETVAASNAALVSRASRAYQEEHSLSDADMARVADVAGNLGVLPGLMAPVDPFTGLPREIPDPHTALQRAFAIAQSQLPDLATASLERQAQKTRAVNHRKQRLQAVSGSSGSSSRKPPPPSGNPRDALLASVTAFMEGDFQEN